MIPPLLVIFAYPLVALLLFSRLPRPGALIWTLLLGYLFLPTLVQLDLPVLPAINKDSMPVLSALLCLLIFKRATDHNTALPGFFPRQPIILILLLGIVASKFLTIATNGDVLRIGALVLPALRIYDGFSAILTAIMSLLPFLLARKYLSNDDSHALILKLICISGAIYSLPIIFELVMSPQLNNIVYGFFPHSWRQHIRDGGFRPIVFLQHGLWVGIFICTAVLAAFGAWRVSNPGQGAKFLYLGVWLLLILMASKTLGALAIGLLFAPIALFAHRRLQFILAAAVAASVLFYPTLRGSGVVPTTQIVNLATAVNEQRARSLAFRLLNEDRLLEKTSERPIFGWGGWNRARVYDADGNDISTTDGLWIITISEHGWVGYLCQFGLLCAPILLLAAGRRPKPFSIATSALCLVLAANLIDLIPNAGLTPITWLVAGALAGRLEPQRETAGPTVAEVPIGPKGNRYTRYAVKPGRAAARGHRQRQHVS